MKLRNQKGFTLIELVLVITVLGILAVAALPQFLNITSNADEAARDGVVGAIRSGLSIKYADYLANSSAQPTHLGTADALDAAGDCSGGCFGNVLSDPIVSTQWSSGGDDTYTYTAKDATTTSYTFVAGDATKAGTFQ